MGEPSSETRSVVIERELPYPAEKIWRALTQPHLIEQWLMQNDFQALVGHRFNLRRSPAPGVNIVVDCEVRVVESNRTLSYTWAAFGLESVVTWTLTPTRSGTHLRMEHSGFPADQPQAYRGAQAGWRQFLAALGRVLQKPQTA